jgi:DNA-directed RNA polymerase specialized sigma24 family protein
MRFRQRSRKAGTSGDSTEFAAACTPEQQQLFDKFYRVLYPQCTERLEWLLGYDGADDAVQTAMIGVWRNWGDLPRERQNEGVLSQGDRVPGD